MNDKNQLTTLEIVVMTIGVIFLLVFFFGNNSMTREITSKYICYENVCSKTSLDNFNECIDLGVETVGFLASEHYYLCDGIRVTNTCTNYKKEVINNTEMSFFELGMHECGLKEDAFSGKSEEVED